MKIEITDPYGYTHYNSLVGSFVVIKPDNAIEWMGRCRVEFEWGLKRVNFHTRVGFQHRTGLNLELMRNFWAKIFKKLGKDSEFTINESNFNNLCIIDLPDFWNKTDTARSLFSLLLRASVIYHAKGHTLLKTLKAYPLAVKAMPAIKWYLKGNTIPTYDVLTKRDYEGFPGFVAEFQGLTNEEISKKLISKIS